MNQMVNQLNNQNNNQVITSGLVERNRFRNVNDFFGNEVTKTLLINSLIQDSHHNVNIFVGPPGSGKSTFAILYAKSLNCENMLIPGVPCEQCSSCLSLAIKDGHPDVKHINAALDNGIETSRILSEFVKGKPTFKKKVIILDEWHRMSSNALDGLLTIFESASMSDASVSESDYLFIMPTTNVPKDHLALYSRAQKFFFEPMSRPELMNKLRDICNKSNIKFEDSALDLICNTCNKAARDSITLLQTAAVYTNGDITKGAMEKLLSLEDSSLAKDVLQAIFALNATKTTTLIKEYSQNRVINENDFNKLSELIHSTSENAAACTQELFTKLLKIVQSGRNNFLNDCSTRPEENLIITCREMVITIMNFLPAVICETVKGHDEYFGNLVASLNPICKIDKVTPILELDTPTKHSEYIISGLNSELMSSILCQFGVQGLKFRNIAPEICNYIITQDKEFGEFLFNLKPEVIVENNSLVLALNAPTEDRYNYLQAGLNNEFMRNYFSSINIRSCKFK